ncbi:MAG: adenylyl-sulfate kinase [Deltaproteobacteria bacterium]|nr:adenylyl-sulfate kinase [Deltaproteobacteria bacterium]
MMNPDHRWTGTIWITGLSAAGKTTLGRGLRELLAGHGIHNVQLLDGEELRKSSGRSYGFSTTERAAFALRIAKVARECNENGDIAIVCAISHVKEIRQTIREQFHNFMEVYLSCPVEICAARDYKGHYEKAFAGVYDNFIGVTEPYQPSDRPELTIDTAKESIDQCTRILFEGAMAFLKSANGKHETIG